MKKRLLEVFVLSMAAILLSVSCGRKVEFQGYGVSSDVDPLRRVIMLTPGEDGARQSYWLYADNPFYVITYDEGAIAQHRGMMDKMRAQRIEVIEIQDLIASALRNARAEAKFDSALEEMFPLTFPLLRNYMESLTPDDLLGRTDDINYSYDEEGRFRPLIEPAFAFYFTRDFAVMTPKGLILTNAKESWRGVEHRLGRFIFTYADGLRDCPVLFDAEKEGVFCEGGDILVRDEKTIFMGIHNFSDSAAAEKIARTLDMDVIGVAMPPYEDFSGANIEIMHLDTVFNFVDRDKILTVPYLFEAAYDGKNPLTDLLGSIEGSLEHLRELKKAESETGVGEAEGEGKKAREPEEKTEPEAGMSLAMAVKNIPTVGWLTRYRAGSGEMEELKTKLVDYLREEGYRVIWVGGDRGEMREDKYIMERVFYELSLQAANVVQLAPGKVLAYAHNKQTIRALRDGGVEVVTFEGKYLADGLGGPHCLTMPMLRK